MRKNADVEFSKIFHIVEEKDEKVNFSIEILIICGRMAQQSHKTTYLFEAHYRKNVSIPFLVINQLEKKFTADEEVLSKFSVPMIYMTNLTLKL